MIFPKVSNKTNRHPVSLLPPIDAGFPDYFLIQPPNLKYFQGSLRKLVGKADYFGCCHAVRYSAKHVATGVPSFRLFLANAMHLPWGGLHPMRAEQQRPASHRRSSPKNHRQQSAHVIMSLRMGSSPWSRLTALANYGSSFIIFIALLIHDRTLVLPLIVVSPKKSDFKAKKHILGCFGTPDPPPLFCLGPFPKWHHFRILIVCTSFFITWMVGGNPLACFDQECCPQRDNQPTMVPTEWAWGHLLTHIGQTNSPPTPLGLAAV